MRRTIIWLLIIMLGISAFAYFDRPKFDNAVNIVVERLPFFPSCSKPLAYSVGDFDERFAISRGEFIADIQKAEKIWEDASGKDLFVKEENGEVEINLIYDYRQAATDKLRSIGIIIDTSNDTYNSLKAKYDAYTISFKAEKAALLEEIGKVDRDRDVYDESVEYWNGHGGAPKKEYDKLEEMRIELNREISAVKQRQDALNDKADTINSLATVINQLIGELNLNVTKYNTTAEDTGEEFDEGVYISDATGQRIDIYQFADEKKLVRVLAHELGHALGMEHVSDPKAIMYKLNQSTNEEPADADITELDRVCHGL